MKTTAPFPKTYDSVTNKTSPLPPRFNNNMPQRELTGLPIPLIEASEAPSFGSQPDGAERRIH